MKCKMKCKVMFVLLMVAVAWVAGRNLHANHSVTKHGDGREEIHRSFQLAPGAEIELKGINGPVEVETADTDTAELHIWRSADNREDLENNLITIEQTPLSLSIRGKQRERWWKFWNGGSVRQQVKLIVPRKVELSARGINGPLTVGRTEGEVHVSGINGRVELAETDAYTEISGVNGHVKIAIARLSDAGFSVKGINGGVELRVPQELNADLRIKGLNGGVSCDLKNFSEEERTRSGLTGRLGTGGAEISVTGINGGVHLSPVATSGN